jgi:hypothetical protein
MVATYPYGFIVELVSLIKYLDNVGSICWTNLLLIVIF